MTIDIEALRTQKYSDRLELLSQQMKPILAQFSREEDAKGAKAFRMESQLNATNAVERTTRAKPAIDIDVIHDGRWVFPRTFDWGKVIDAIDLNQTNILPQSKYVMSAIAALNRQSDDLFTGAFFGDAQTDETGSTTTSFPAAQQVAVTVGPGANTGLNIPKLRNAQKILLEGDVMLDAEEIHIGIAPFQHDELLALTQIVSTDFNLAPGDRPVLEDGFVRRFLGMNFHISNRLPTDANAFRRLPVWVPSGMGRGTWQALKGEVRKRPDLQGNPDYAEATMTNGYTRLEEAKCVEIKCSEV